MSTQETITRIEDVRCGDVVTLERDGVTVTGPATECMGNAHVEVDGYGLCTDDGWRFVSATREVRQPEPIEPGTAGTATVRGVPDVKVVRLHSGWMPLTSEVDMGGCAVGIPDGVPYFTNFVPDARDCGRPEGCCPHYGVGDCTDCLNTGHTHETPSRES